MKYMSYIQDAAIYLLVVLNALVSGVLSYVHPQASIVPLSPETTLNATFSCDAEHSYCVCAGPRTSEACKEMEMSGNCVGVIQCAGISCKCKYWPGYLGGARRRD